MAVIHMVGGKGDQSAANIAAGGAFDDSGTMEWDAAQGTNGAILADTGINGGDITDNGSGKVRITDAPTFGAGVSNAWKDIYIDLDGVSTHAAGKYKITASTATTIDIDLTYAGDETCRARVGGALPNITQSGVQDSADLVTAGDFIRVAVDDGGSASIPFSSTVDIDQNSGTVNSRITIEGVDNAGVRLTPGAELPVFTTGSALAGGLVQIGVNKTYWDIHTLDVNGGGEGKAKFGIYNPSAFSDFWRIFNCKVHNTDQQAVSWVGDRGTFAFNEVYDADKVVGGFRALVFQGQYSLVIGNSVHDNPGTGLYVNDLGMKVSNNLVYDNGGIGIEVEEAGDFSSLNNNTIYGNDVGVFIDTDAEFCFVWNNTSSGNTTVNWDLDADATHFGYFAYNHSHDGGGDVADSFTWATLGEGNNITGDPLFVSVASGSQDFTPRHGSALLAAGAPASFAIAGNPLAITNYQDIGAVSRQEPKPRLVA